MKNFRTNRRCPRKCRKTAHCHLKDPAERNRNCRPVLKTVPDLRKDPAHWKTAHSPPVHWIQESMTTQVAMTVLLMMLSESILPADLQVIRQLQERMRQERKEGGMP